MTEIDIRRKPSGDWAIEMGRYSVAVPATGPEVESWVEDGQPANGAPTERIAALAKRIATARHKPAAPWRGAYRWGYLPLDGEEEVTLHDIRKRACGPGAPSTVVAGIVSCTSPRCRERDAEGAEVLWRRLVVRYPGSVTLDPRIPAYPGASVSGYPEAIEGRDPAEVLAGHQAWHQDRYPTHPRVALSIWITNNAMVRAPELTPDQRAAHTAALAAARAERAATRTTRRKEAVNV